MVLRVAMPLLLALLAGCAANPRPEAPAVAGEASGPATARVEAAAGAGAPQPPPTPGKNEGLPVNPDESIFFAPGSSTIASSERRKLKLLAARLLAERRQSVTLVGYAADHGSRSFNLAIVDSRIGAVATVLKKHGVSAYQIRRRVGSGEVRPATCRSSECGRLMRRVDLVFPEAAGGD